MKQYNIGLIGCGFISDIYLKNLTTRYDNTNMYALCDLTRSRAEDAAKKYNIPHVMDMEELIACDEIDAILILTLPASHYDISKKCLLAGKHAYVEKPLAFTKEEGKELAALAESKGLLLGCAPDTFLGASLRTAHKFIEEGLIGDITTASAFFGLFGHENWHPEPAFFYQKGGGPMLDVGPYYITALVSLMGKADAVCGFTTRAFDKRIITSEPRKGEFLDVDVETHVSGNIRFTNGAIASVTTSFDIARHSMPFLEIHGTKGSLKLNDPNIFYQPIYYCPWGENEWQELPIDSAFDDCRENSRGVGLSQMLSTLETGEAALATGALASHVLEIMLAFEESSKTGMTVKIS